jgi:hypothetical protein
VGMPEGRRPLERPRRRWVNSIKINLIGWGGIDWIYLAQDKNQCEDGNEPSGCLSSCTTGGFSRRAQLREVS